MTKRVAHCHKLVAYTAKSFAHQLYDVLMKDNEMFAAWKKRWPGKNAIQLENLFVARYWGACIEQARATLAASLRGPLDENVKEDILEALILDKTLVRGRIDPQMQLN